jgi:hypothetical protein
MGIIPKEVKGGTNIVHRTKEVTTKVISILINPLYGITSLAKLKPMKTFLKSLLPMIRS